jgi:hypothetical protein
LFMTFPPLSRFSLGAFVQLPFGASYSQQLHRK